MASSSRPTKRAFRHTSNQTTTSSPSFFLPATIQTSLLSVGMRIRKAVPEGYKTSPKSFFSNSYGSLRVDGSSHRNYGSSGLMPYCGILKTGNLEPQASKEDVPPLDFGPGDSDFPSSQESAVSETSTGGWFDALPLLVNCNKRLYEEDDGPSPIHPDPLRSNPIHSSPVARDMALRPMLQRKTRKAVSVGGGKLKEQEIEVMDVDDFGEATFLEYENIIEDEEFRSSY